MKKVIDILENTLHLKVYKKDSDFGYKKSIPFIIKKSYDISSINIENIDCVVLTPNDEDLHTYGRLKAILNINNHKSRKIQYNFLLWTDNH